MSTAPQAYTLLTQSLAYYLFIGSGNGIGEFNNIASGGDVFLFIISLSTLVMSPCAVILSFAATSAAPSIATSATPALTQNASQLLRRAVKPLYWCAGKCGFF